VDRFPLRVLRRRPPVPVYPAPSGATPGGVVFSFFRPTAFDAESSAPLIAPRNPLLAGGGGADASIYFSVRIYRRPPWMGEYVRMYGRVSQTTMMAMTKLTVALRASPRPSLTGPTCRVHFSRPACAPGNTPPTMGATSSLEIVPKNWLTAEPRKIATAKLITVISAIFIIQYRFFLR